MSYEVIWSDEALEDLEKLKRLNKGKLVEKAYSLTVEIMMDPCYGTGRPEPLRMGRKLWSRRINHEHRLVYMINEKEKTVRIVSAWGHYGDK